MKIMILAAAALTLGAVSPVLAQSFVQPYEQPVASHGRAYTGQVYTGRSVASDRLQQGYAVQPSANPYENTVGHNFYGQ